MSLHSRALLMLSIESGLATGCTALPSEGTSSIGGVAGSVTRNAAIASGIGFGVLAASQAGSRRSNATITASSRTGSPGPPARSTSGTSATGRGRHRIELEPDEGRVTVSRLIGAADLRCKEIVFTVD